MSFTSAQLFKDQVKAAAVFKELDQFQYVPAESTVDSGEGVDPNPNPNPGPVNFTLKVFTHPAKGEATRKCKCFSVFHQFAPSATRIYL